MKRNTLLIVLLVIAVGITVIVIRNLQAKNTQQFLMDDGLMLEMTADKDWEIKKGDSEDSYGIKKGDFFIGGTIEKIDDSVDIKQLQRSWPTIHGIDLDTGLGMYELDASYVELGEVNGIKLYRKDVSKLNEKEDMSQIQIYGLVNNKLTRVFIDNKRVFWNISYNIPENLKVTDTQVTEEIKRMDEFVKNIKIK